MIKKLKRLFSKLGPGFVTGAADDDPSGIGTYAQTGASFGYSQLWTVPFFLPFMIAIQEICGRIGMVSGKGLAGVIKHEFPKPLLYLVVAILLIANTVNIGADLGAMASAAQLLVNVPFVVLLIIMAIVILTLEIFLSYAVYSKILRYLAFSLLTYIAVTFIVKQDWTTIFVSTIIPNISLSRDYVLNIAALLGTTISPYLFFWQADEEVEEEVENRKLRFFGKGIPRINMRDIKKMRMDTLTGMVFSQIVTFFIITSAASTLNFNGVTSVQTASDAANALAPIAGQFSSVLFAAGIIGTGLLAVPILAGSASYAISESFSWRAGLNKKFKQAHGFYGVITIAMLVGLLVNFTSIKPFTLLYYTAILNAICAPLLLLLIMIIANNKKIMGNYTNKVASNIGGWGITVIMFIVAILSAVAIVR